MNLRTMLWGAVHPTKSPGKHLQQMWGSALRPLQHSSLLQLVQQSQGSIPHRQSEEAWGTAPHWDRTAKGKLRQGAGKDVQTPWVVPEVSGPGPREVTSSGPQQGSRCCRKEPA